ncbi:hypothetical protein H072_7815 [Dactylellina haptotyla CBS 200.50]|uniref:Uncharacterized protein n=1 Tax=Dactylellina haptotyla (strain CBS 200.50) TaxID=1284197 RepID=S8A601_DACHA|nr:hypothetical protein H072_7815 [Dactylellina haptotyla CBS 200.50]
MASYTLNIRVDPSVVPTFTGDKSLILYKKVNDSPANYGDCGGLSKQIETKPRGDVVSISPADSSKVAEWKEPAGPAHSNVDMKPRDQYILSWKNHISADPDDESEGYSIIFEAETTKSVRFGYKDPNKPRQDDDAEIPTFYPVD